MRSSTRPTVIGVDGHGGSGKSTLAAELAGLLAAEVVHTDDFASGDDLLDWWPLVIDQVFLPMTRGAKSLSYPRTRWWPGHHPEPVTGQSVTPVMILEGVTALRAEFRPYLAFGIYVDTAREVCMQRGCLRDRGRAGHDDDRIRAIWEEWYREEEEIMNRYLPWEVADIVVDGTKPLRPQIEDWVRAILIDRTPRNFPPDEDGGIPGPGPTLTR